MIITSNVSYGEWGGLTGDPLLAAAMLDRRLHSSVTLNIRSPSYRLKDRLRSRPSPTVPTLSREGGEL